jgi:integrase
MSKIYRVTPKNGKWIIQRISDRVTVSAKPFIKKSDAEAAMIAMIAPDLHKENIDKQITFKKAFRNFATWKQSLHEEGSRVDPHSLQRYDTEYRQRISKYMADDVLLSRFNIKDMENYLDECKKAGVPFKTMRKSVKDIKHFIRRAKAEGLEPCEDMLTYNILDNLKVVPQDDDLLYKKEVDLDIMPDDKVKAIINDLHIRMKTDRHAANGFAIFCMFFFFGLRASELSAIHRDFSATKSCVDFDNALLHIRGSYRHHTYQNKTKNRGSKRSIEIDPYAMKFLEIWLDYLDGKDTDNPYLLPGKNGGPLSYKYIHATMWKTYAAHGLADITVRRDGHVIINSSPIKGFATKIFRHRLATTLIDNMNQHKELGRNRVKHLIGHTQFSTSSNIYGNKVRRGTDEERAAVAKAKAKAIGSDIFTKAIEN